MPRPSRALLASLLACSLASGCAAHAPAYTIGRFVAPREDLLFSAVSRAILDEGYAITRADPSRGRIEAGTRWHRGDRRPQLVVQLVRPGWVVLAVEGEEVEPEGDGFRVHRALARELEELALHLRERLETGDRR